VSVIIEAELPGEAEMIELLTSKLEQLLRIGTTKFLPLLSLPATYQTTARFRVAANAEVDFGFDPKSASDLSLRDNLANFNFLRLEEGFVLGYMNKKCLWLENYFDEDFTHEYLVMVDKEIRVKKSSFHLCSLKISQS
jgi:hypothetical protein